MDILKKRGRPRLSTCKDERRIFYGYFEEMWKTPAKYV